MKSSKVWENQKKNMIFVVVYFLRGSSKSLFLQERLDNRLCLYAVKIKKFLEIIKL